MAAEDGRQNRDDDDDIPLHHRKPFSAGLRHRQVKFVPASVGNLSTTVENEPAATSASSVADFYLNIVLPPKPTGAAAETAEPAAEMCEVCQMPLDDDNLGAATTTDAGRSGGAATASRHATSIAHQVCLAHSHPPSALDRSRMGLAVLQSQGWDPDERKGLGASRQGMQYPLKATPKDDTLGIGVKPPKNLEARRKDKVQKLDAGQARKKAAEDKKRRDRLQQHFYGSSDIEKYLGGG